MTVREIAQLTGAELFRGTELDRRVADVAQIDRAGPSDLAFVEHARYAPQLATSRAGACLTTDKLADQAPPHVAVLLSREPYRAFVTVASRLFPSAQRPSSLFEAEGVAKNAVVHPSARLENGVTVDPGAVVGPRAEIGAGTVVAATAVIGPDVRVGRDCAIGAGCVVTHALMGDHVILHPGCKIGQDGYAYMAGVAGHAKIIQIGRVIIQDGVEIGANTTIDRGGIRDTVIGEGTKIDNQVQIGHNVRIGRHCLVVAQVGISGSSTVGDYVVLAGQVGVKDHVTIGDGAMVAAKSAVYVSIPAGERWGGYPAMPVDAWKRSMMQWRRLSRSSPRTAQTVNAKEDE